MSVSFIASLPARQNAQVRAQIEDLIATHPALRGRDVVSFPYKHAGVRRAAAVGAIIYTMVYIHHALYNSALRAYTP